MPQHLIRQRAQMRAERDAAQAGALQADAVQPDSVRRGRESPGGES
jgi:hypothetical protein